MIVVGCRIKNASAILERTASGIHKWPTAANDSFDATVTQFFGWREEEHKHTHIYFRLEGQGLPHFSVLRSRFLRRRLWRQLRFFIVS